jgi:hypothetical protein
MTYVSNAFSLQMIMGIKSCDLVTNEIPEEEFREGAKGEKSCIGHPDTAKVLGLPFNRESISLEIGDMLLVAQLQGGRLPEGATELPEGFSFRYFAVHVQPQASYFSR